LASRIPQAFIDELLDRTDIVDLVDGHVKLKKQAATIQPAALSTKKKPLPLVSLLISSFIIALAAVPAAMLLAL